MKKLSYITYALVIISGLAVMSALWSWYNPPTQIIKEYVEVKVPVPYRIVSTVTKTIKQIVYLEKTQVVTVEKWPDWFTQDANKQITAIGDVPTYKGTTRVASVIDLSTGKSNLVQNRLPMSLFGFENDKRIGIRYGSTDKGTELNFYGDWTFFRVGSFYISGYAEAGNGYKAMLDTSYRF